MRIAPRSVAYGGAMFDQSEIDAVMKQLSNPAGLIPGAKVCEFERRVADLMGKAHGVMVNSGSSALTVAMRLANLPRGSEVITPPPSDTASQDPVARMQKLKTMHDAGLITDEEFQATRARILAEM